MHPFEKAKLGTAPFRCTGVETRWHGEGEGRKPGGTCNYCGTGILYCFHIVGADGSKFIVGSDCVLKTHAEDMEGFKVARRKLVREKREAGRRARQAERQALWAAQRESRYAEFLAAEPELAAFLSSVPDDGNSFMVKMRDSVFTWGSLTAGQLAAVKTSLQRDAQRKAEQAASKFVGEVGKRIEGEFEIIAIRQYDAQVPGTWRTRLITWSLMRKDGQDLVTYKGNYLGNRGEKFKAKFTVKEHETYNGTRQTKLSRPKVIEEPKAAGVAA